MGTPALPHMESPDQACRSKLPQALYQEMAENITKTTKYPTGELLGAGTFGFVVCAESHMEREEDSRDRGDGTYQWPSGFCHTARGLQTGLQKTYLVMGYVRG